MKKKSITAIIVSGGYSSRMGSFKPLLKFGEKTAIGMIIEAYQRAGVKNIIVVAGYRGEEIEGELRGSGVICLQNEKYAEGMFTSVVKGVEALDTETSAFFMQPVDIPLIRKYTIELLIKKYMDCGKGILYPDFCGNAGHPPLIDCKYGATILRSRGDGGLKKILEEYSADSIHVPVFERSILMDMDTKEDYERLIKYYNVHGPDAEECGNILKQFGVPEQIEKHGQKVAEVAKSLLQRLNGTKWSLDEEALTAAALLHDMAKKEKNHAQAAEQILKELGYGAVGDIIGSHMDIEVTEDENITENELLYLADKLVRGDEIISLEERFRAPLLKYRDNPEIRRQIENRRASAYKIIKKIETASRR